MRKKILYSIIGILGLIILGACAVLALSAPISYVAVALPQPQQAAVIQPIINTEQQTPLPVETPDTTQTPTPKPAKNPCPQPTKKYPDYSYLNVGQEVAIPDKTYIPSDLTLLDKSVSTSNICLKKVAADAVTTMIKDAKKEEYNIKVSSGFRSYNTQEGILSRDIASGNPNATKLVAKPGYSEHQLGMAVDLTSSSIQYASAATKFENTKESDWLEDHAADYGFIESYPEDKEDITGYLHEAWHYRYVGIDNAAQIIKNGQTTNQFLKDLNDTAKAVQKFIETLTQ